MLRRLFKDESGQGMVEYGLIIALIAIAVITALIAMRGGLEDTFQEIEEGLTERGSDS